MLHNLCDIIQVLNCLIKLKYLEIPGHRIDRSLRISVIRIYSLHVVLYDRKESPIKVQAQL